MKEALKLIIDPPCSAARNMAVDHLLFEDSGAWLRLYQWEIPSVSLGYFQSSQEVNLQAIKDSNTALVRRITGGKAVLHQHELTYSLSVPVDWFPGALHESYKAIGLCLLEGLKQLGVDSELVERKPEAFENGNCFQVPGWYELISRGKKIIGSAQKRRRGRLLQHGSLLIDRDNELIRKIFSHNNDEPLESICLKDILGKKPEMVDIIEAFKEGFSQLGYPIKPSIISREEECRVTELIKERYGSDEWTLGR